MSHRDIPEVVEARRRLAEARQEAAVELARIGAELDSRPTPDNLRGEAAATVWHIGRAWTGHEIEDTCPCPKASCGLVEQRSLTGGCDQHNGTKTTRQGHPAERCPGEAA